MCVRMFVFVFGRVYVYGWVRDVLVCHINPCASDVYYECSCVVSCVVYINLYCHRMPSKETMNNL